MSERTEGTHQRQDACDPHRLAGRRRSKRQVCLIDHYLDRRPVPRRQLQLVGVAAMSIASKLLKRSVLQKCRISWTSLPMGTPKRAY